MDDVDLKLIKLLWENPRAPYRDLADALSISTTAVHRRIQAAKDSEILLGPYTHLSHMLVDAVPVIIIGHSEAQSLAEVGDALGKGENVELITMMSGNVFSIRGKLKRLNQLDEYVAFVQKGAKIANPEICLNPSRPCDKFPDYSDIKLSKLDFKIMAVLRKDGRMPINEIADEISASPKTVKRHLHYLMDKEILWLSYIADQSHSGDFVPMLKIYLDHKTEKNEVMKRLINEHSPPILDPATFGNQPRFILAHAWLHSMADLRALLDDLENEKGVESVVPNIYIKSIKLDSWLEKILDTPDKSYEYVMKRL